MEHTPSDEGFLEHLRRRRAELRESMSAVEAALAGPAYGDEMQWATRVQVALVELSADLSEHIRITEGPDGLYRELLSAEPRLSEPVARLTSEHTAIRGRLDDLVGLVEGSDGPVDVTKVRDLGTTLLGVISHHRQRGADLVYEAYEFDIGGDT